jgi:hypothetical protein
MTTAMITVWRDVTPVVPAVLNRPLLRGLVGSDIAVFLKLGSVKGCQWVLRDENA